MRRPGADAAPGLAAARNRMSDATHGALVPVRAPNPVVDLRHSVRRRLVQ
jgi:hypothetical protein